MSVLVRLRDGSERLFQNEIRTWSDAGVPDSRVGGDISPDYYFLVDGGALTISKSRRYPRENVQRAYGQGEWAEVQYTDDVVRVNRDRRDGGIVETRTVVPRGTLPSTE